MTEYTSAFDEIKSIYDIETLTAIDQNGCNNGCAEHHKNNDETIAFFDKYEEEIKQHISDTLGEEFITELKDNNSDNEKGYKNDTTWTYIELVASQLLEEYEDLGLMEGDE